jgi:hypothetical protein
MNLKVGHKVWWIFDNLSTRSEIESPDLQVELWVKPQEVSPFVMMMVSLFAVDIISVLQLDTLQYLCHPLSNVSSSLMML